MDARDVDDRAGPIVGQAWKYLLELRIERGPMTREAGLAALKEWSAEQGLDAD